MNINFDIEDLRKVQRSIKHPHFYYAEYYPESGQVIFKKKKWYKWFSGKRVVYVTFKNCYLLEED